MASTLLSAVRPSPQPPGRQHAAQRGCRGDGQRLQSQRVQASDDALVAPYLDAQQEEQQPDEHGDKTPHGPQPVAAQQESGRNAGQHE